jgi:hypothetical protein
MKTQSTAEAQRRREEESLRHYPRVEMLPDPGGGGLPFKFVCACGREFSRGQSASYDALALDVQRVFEQTLDATRQHFEVHPPNPPNRAAERSKRILSILELLRSLYSSPRLRVSAVDNPPAPAAPCPTPGNNQS